MRKRQTILIMFIVIQIIALILFFRNKQYDYIYETIIIIAGSLYLAYISYRHQLPIPDYIVIIVLISLCGHTIGGQLLNLYVKSNVFDKYLHIFGTYSFAMLGYFYLGIYNIALTKRKKFIIIMMIGLSLGVIYELVEFATDYFIQPAIPAQPSLIDTNIDLLADLIGALLASIHLSRK